MESNRQLGVGYNRIVTERTSHTHFLSDLWLLYVHILQYFKFDRFASMIINTPNKQWTVYETGYFSIQTIGEKLN